MAGKTSKRKHERARMLRFGSVAMRVNADDLVERIQNVRRGQASLEKMTCKLLEPGVKIRARKDVPLFFADPADPRRIVRELNGEREIGSFENGKFKARV